MMVTPAIAAEVQARSEPQAVAAPTQQVITKPLPAPAFESDIKNIQEIINREETPPVKDPAKDLKPVVIPHPPAPVPAMAVKPPPSATAPPPLKAEPVEEQSCVNDLLTEVRIFAIRWHEVLDLVFLAAITWFVYLLYREQRSQNRYLARSVQATEDAARAAQKSLNPTEIRTGKARIAPTDAQARFDL